MALLRLSLTAKAESAVRRGHPWVYAASVVRQNREGASGELAVIFDRRGGFLALGLFDPDSPIRLRIVHRGAPVQIDDEWWAKRFAEAIARRREFGPATTGFRLIHGESDGWPGLVLDQYGDTLVLKLYSAVWFGQIEMLRKLIESERAPARLVVRFSRNMIPRAERELGLKDGQFLAGEPGDGKTQFLENGLCFEADVARGQKTGFFLDQRENRLRIRSLASGADVLNAFSFSGGFSVYAAAGGALSVTDLDISTHALESGRVNFELNRNLEPVRRCKRRAVQADVFEWVRAAAPGTYDLVVLDPPSLARRESERAEAVAVYERLARSAIPLLRDRGRLLACSCSAHVSKEEFFDAVRRAAQRSKRRWAEEATTGHPIDHPAAFAEAEYLKGIYLRFGAG